ncbi:hypothetical protein OSTOST_13899 [Ostertagia ostertagi]
MVLFQNGQNGGFNQGGQMPMNNGGFQNGQNGQNGGFNQGGQMPMNNGGFQNGQNGGFNQGGQMPMNNGGTQNGQNGGLNQPQGPAEQQRSQQRPECPEYGASSHRTRCYGREIPRKGE